MEKNLTQKIQQAEKNLRTIRAEKRQINKQLQEICLEEKRLDALMQKTVHA
jgi:hypothetical protein